MMTLLSDFEIGQSGKVLEITGTDSISMRLLEMGLTPDVEVSVIGSAPLGDPIEISVRGYRLSLRRTEAERVKITPV